MNKGHSPSPHQRLVEQLTEKKAILKCREVSEYYDMKNLPECVMTEIHNNGYMEYYNACPKILVSVPEDREPVEYILNLILRLNHVGEIKQQLKAMKV